MNWKYGEPHEWRCAQAFMLGEGHKGLREEESRFRLRFKIDLSSFIFVSFA